MIAEYSRKLRTTARSALVAVALGWAALISQGALALEEVTDAELGQIAGQEGVSIGLEVRINTDATGQPLPDATLTECGSTGTTFTNSECRFALSFQGRTDEWLLFRGIYGFIDINEIRLDAGIISDAGTPAAYFDATRFEDPSGTCLLAGGTCTNAALGARPALVFEYPATATSYNPGTGVSAGYTSLLFGLGIKETIVIPNTDPAGFNSTAAGSFLGVNIADNNGGPAGIAIRGRGYFYGF